MRVHNKAGHGLFWGAVHRELLDERSFLWVTDCDPVSGCLIVRPEQDSQSGGVSLNVLLASHHGQHGLSEYWPQVEEIAAAIGAQSIIFQSTRKGFGRVAERFGLKPHAVIYRKEL
ncbi:hypothetical protein KUW19_00885 [Ferrimonas balearica]|uniref:hypothetical protein n=1 Tax=Ferrimonas balearica TaxID=44012 RepID=UPI001C953BC8|nr:hypothetical protein [Ferrimonas balearica]MBY6105032.1 hypothetical protein [Ferrimonas balearica]